MVAWPAAGRRTLARLPQQVATAVVYTPVWAISRPEFTASVKVW